nr:hypothetical protein CKG001_17230 [Bdellovibrio sp. CKG001]
MPSLAFYLSLILLLSATNSFAARKTEWSLHLDSRIEAVYFPQSYGEDTNDDLYRLDLNPIYRWKYLDSIRFTFKPLFVANPNNKSTEEQTFFDPGETFVRYQRENLSLQAGYNIFSWGVTDGYNPLDILNPRQYFDPLHSRKLGLLSLVYSQTLGSWDYEVVFIPLNQGSLLPGDNSRWLPRQIFLPQTADNDLILLLPENLRYHSRARKNLGTSAENNYAFRLQRRGEFIDFSLSAYEGAAGFPLIVPEVTGAIVQVSPKTVIRVDPDVTLNSYNYRIRQGGISFVSNQMNFLFKAVGSYTETLEDNPNLQKWTNENVLGLERTFTFGDSGMLIAILQYSFLNTEKKNDSNLSVSEIFRSAYMAGGRLSWKEVWSANFLGLYDSIHGSTYQEYSLSRRFLDAWVLSGTASFIQGSDDTPLGVYGKNSSYSISLSRSF